MIYHLARYAIVLGYDTDSDIPGRPEEVRKRIDDMIAKDVALILAILPNGATYVEARPEMITDLSLPYTLVFEHPYFSKDTELLLDYRRICWPGVDGLDVGNLLEGFRYRPFEQKESV